MSGQIPRADSVPVPEPEATQTDILRESPQSGPAEPVTGAPPPELTPAALAGEIRAESAGYRLSRADDLAARHPDADIGALAAQAAADAPDLRSMQGSTTTYHYSTLSMTEAYATHLARVEDRDPLRLVAETVRDESRIYPRPTGANAFLEAPFGMGRSELASILLRLGREGGTEDIRSCKASNGAVYLYSSRFLTDDHAKGLAEYYEVECWLNP